MNIILKALQMLLPLADRQMQRMKNGPHEKFVETFRRARRKNTVIQCKWNVWFSSKNVDTRHKLMIQLWLRYFAIL